MSKQGYNMTEELKPFDLADSPDKHRWEALFRGSVITTQANAIINYVTIADQKAQVMLFLNSLVLPLAISGLKQGDHNVAYSIALATAFTTVFSAVCVLIPRGGRIIKRTKANNLMHFSNINRFATFEAYCAEMIPVFNDTQKLSKEAMKLIYDTSSFILKGKFFWLRLCYGIFLVGNFAAILAYVMM